VALLRCRRTSFPDVENDCQAGPRMNADERG
jgi:hypothetical protein